MNDSTALKQGFIFVIIIGVTVFILGLAAYLYF